MKPNKIRRIKGFIFFIITLAIAADKGIEGYWYLILIYLIYWAVCFAVIYFLEVKNEEFPERFQKSFTYGATASLKFSILPILIGLLIHAIK